MPDSADVFRTVASHFPMVGSSLALSLARACVSASYPGMLSIETSVVHLSIPFATLHLAVLAFETVFVPTMRNTLTGSDLLRCVFQQLALPHRLSVG